LKQFDDLLSIGTYGFRGEALASISHIAHLRVTTKTATSSCAWQAHYSDGKLAPAKPGQPADPKPSAGRPGTQITVEDLFYNIPNRRKAFRSPSEEYAKILDVVTKYAVHCSHVAFSIKKHGESGAGFAVVAAASKQDRIKQAYGAAVAKSLTPFHADDDKWGFKASGYMTDANYSGKRTSLLLFINSRSVDHQGVKKALEQTYQAFLPKGGRPFVYLNLEIEPSRVDVNVHPTKREVHFLNEDEIIEVVCAAIHEQLAQIDTSRTFKTQTLLPGVIPMTPAAQQSSQLDTPSESGSRSVPKTPASRKPYENNLVRTDSKLRKITSMLPPALSSHGSLEGDSSTTDGLRYVQTDREQIQIRLTSVKNLRAEVRDSMHTGLTEVFASLTYVGLVDAQKRLAAIQSGVNLYLVDYGMACNEFFYQVGLTDFGNFGLIQLRPALDLKTVLRIAADLEIDTDPSCKDLNRDDIVEKVFDQIMSRKDMLREYFSLEITDSGQLEAIPLLLRGYVPCIAKLPTFLLRLGPFVNWTDEQKCFHTFLQELASFYAPERLSPRPVETDGDPDGENVSLEGCGTQLSKTLENIVFPALRSRIVATKGMIQGVVEVANLKGLYRVFERC
jgi:DNA mismatch repair protein MLH1